VQLAREPRRSQAALKATLPGAECDPQRDFAGHVGGDDFVVLFQSSDWETRCMRIISHFNTAALTLRVG
jgi:hypothetical protein